MENKSMFEEQAEWQAERLGKITASEIHKIMKSGRGKGEYFGQTALSYMDEKISEIITGIPCKDLSGLNAIEWGMAHEFEAIEAFEKKLGYQVEYFGGANPKFYPYNSFSGGSPDGIIHTHVLEVKCPYNSGVHTKNLLASIRNEGNKWMKKNREEYFYQIQFNMLCMDKKKAFFISYDPRPTEEEHKLAVIEMDADEDVQAEMKERIEAAGKLIIESISILYNEPELILAHHDNEVNATIIEPETTPNLL